MSKKDIKKVFVGLSGGVDSSVAALLLEKEGYDVTGIFIHSYNVDGCAERDADDARRVAAQLDIPFYTFDFEKEYWERVVQYMIDGYARGITPNPDIMCNKEIKFGLFLKKALEMGVDYIATGHYIRLQNKRLYIAKDKNKDQSYFLWTLTQEQLQYCLFPVGDYLKSEVRDIAREARLLTAEKKDSQGICFLGQIHLRNFLQKYIPLRSGSVVNENGENIGTHEGVQFYTIGQRHIGVGNLAHGSSSQPHYVVGKDIHTNTLTVAEGRDSVIASKKEIELRDVSFVNREFEIENKEIPIMARIRYRQPLAKAVIYSSTPGTYNLTFEESQKFVAPGQSAVFYSREGELLGGGIIV
ncbi:hypothetical protein LCGC14_0932440 [marine sediment metagenome]|uniref:Uncharacterized protein n=1 Tax=marine sediment metagenome TaxID=412755 RepID=A0A0F9NML7_9ZZZZ